MESTSSRRSCLKCEKEDVKVTVENGVLTLQGERRQEKEEKGKEVPPRRALIRELRPQFHAARIGAMRVRQGRLQGMAY
jgi:hypothetical protein